MLRAKKLCQADGNMALGDVLLKYDVSVVWLYLQAADALADFSCLGGTLGDGEIGRVGIIGNEL